MGKFEHGFGTHLGAVLLWRGVPSASLMLATATATATTTTTTTTTTTKGPFWKPDACSLEPPNNSCRKQKKRNFF